MTHVARSLLTTCAALAPALAPSLVRAQTSAPLPPVGSYALSFDLPEGGGGGLGFRKMTSPARSVGLELQLGITHSESTLPDVVRTTYRVAVGPDVRLYRSARGPVVPFLELGGQLGYAHVEEGRWVLDGGARGGLGVEWFPVTSVSVSGSTGLGFGWRHEHDPDAPGDSWSLGGFRSALRLNLYF